MSAQEIFAQNMRIFRLRKGLSQEALAEKCGLHRTYIGSIEQKNSNITLETMQKIANALDVSPIQLLTNKNQSEKKHADSASANTPNPELDSQRHYALCSWVDGEEPSFSPLNVKNEDLTLRILCALVQEGHSDDLEQAYSQVQGPIIKYFEKLRAETRFATVPSTQENGGNQLRGM